MYYKKSTSQELHNIKNVETLRISFIHEVDKRLGIGSSHSQSYDFSNNHHHIICAGKKRQSSFQVVIYSLSFIQHMLASILEYFRDASKPSEWKFWIFKYWLLNVFHDWISTGQYRRYLWLRQYVIVTLRPPAIFK